MALTQSVYSLSSVKIAFNFYQRALRLRKINDFCQGHKASNFSLNQDICCQILQRFTRNFFKTRAAEELEVEIGDLWSQNNPIYRLWLALAKLETNSIHFFRQRFDPLRLLQIKSVRQASIF